VLDVSALDFDSQPGRDLLQRISDQTSPQLAAMSRRLERAFFVASPFAPGFHCVGGLVPLDEEAASISGSATLSVTGNGDTPEAALRGCLGEAAEYLSQFERPGDIHVRGGDDAARLLSDGWIGRLISASADRVDFVAARDAASGDAALLPADLCLRRRPARRAIEPVGALSSGVAAGPSLAAAALRAALELCERDAAALWWLGGCRPKSFPLEHGANQAGTDLIARLRNGATLRRALLLDITTDLGVPTVAAVSLDQDGRGMACGLAARLAWHAAARAAVLEMCQMEMAASVAEAKRAESGEAALNEADRRHLRRAAFAAADCELLHPCGVAAPGIAGTVEGGALEDLIGRLSACGVRIYLVDLTRPDLNIPVVRAVSTALQPFSAAVSTERFARLRCCTDGGESATSGTPLL
jgi:thiazole/oxazole-forming peptide maturase SagD family component